MGYPPLYYRVKTKQVKSATPYIIHELFKHSKLFKQGAFIKSFKHGV